MSAVGLLGLPSLAGSEDARLAGYVPATWRGMPGVDLSRPVVGISFMTFDGKMIQLVLSDLDVQRMVGRILEAMPESFAHQVCSSFQSARDAGRLTEAGSIPRGVGSQSPRSNRSSTFSGDDA